MELMDSSLRTYLDQVPLSDREFDYIIKSVINGVKYLHHKNIIHCDLKPENILLRFQKTDDNNDSNDNNDRKKFKISCLKIADFGLVMEPDHSIASEEYGTPTYMPPDAKQGIINTSYDIYSLGIIFFELFNKYETRMERNLELEKFRRGEIENLNPSVDFSYLAKMIHPNYEMRPTIQQIEQYYINY